MGHKTYFLDGRSSEIIDLQQSEKSEKNVKLADSKSNGSSRVLRDLPQLHVHSVW
jgi:hypothetical protein